MFASQVVVTGTLLGHTVDSFGATQQADYKSELAFATGVPETYITLTVTAGSVIVEASIRTASVEQTSEVVAAIQAAVDESKVTDTFMGIAVTAPPVLAAVNVIIAAPPVPNGGMSSGAIVAIAIGACACAVVIGYFHYNFHGKQQRSRPDGPNTAAPKTVQLEGVPGISTPSTESETDSETVVGVEKV